MYEIIWLKPLIYFASFLTYLYQISKINYPNSHQIIRRIRHNSLENAINFSAIHAAGECADPKKNDCDVNADCIDVYPSRHFCTCKVGFIGDGRRCDGKNFRFSSIYLNVLKRG